MAIEPSTTPENLIRLLSSPPANLIQLLTGNIALVLTPTSTGHTPLHYLSLHEDVHPLSQVLPLLPSSAIDTPCCDGDQYLQTPLHWACVSGPVESVRLLLEYGADVKKRDGRGYDAVIHASQYGRVDVVHLLGGGGGADKNDCTPLMWAGYYDHVGVVRYLLMTGANVDSRDEMGMTVLHRAGMRDNWGIVEMLLRYNADIWVEDVKGRTANEVVIGRSRMILNAYKRKRWGGWKTWWLWKHSFVWFFYFIFALSYAKFYSIQHQEMSLGYYYPLANIIMLSCFIFHWKATYRDPGTIARGSEEEFFAYIDRVIGQGVSGTRLLPSAFCFTCLAIRPQRSKHSRERDACVRRFDHECPWVNNTIGLQTHKPLLLLLITNLASETIFIYVVSQQLLITAKDVGWGLILQKPLSVFLVIIHILVGSFCIMLFLTQMQLIVRGATTYEHLVAMREKREYAYDRGCRQNVWSFIMSSGPGTTERYVAVDEQFFRWLWMIR